MQSDAIIDTIPTISRINRRKGSESPMQKLLCAAVCVLSVGLAAYGETLTYQGGGIWDSSSLTWRDASGASVAWKDGAVAAFPAPATVEVVDGITAGGMVVGMDAAPDATVTFTGAALTFAADAVIETSVGHLVFENDVKGAGNLTVERAAGVVVSDELAGGTGFPFGAANAVTVFRNRKLSDVKAVSGALTTFWWQNENADYLYPGNGADRGVYSVENDGTCLTALFQGYHYLSQKYRDGKNVTVKLVLEQVGDDIRGYVESCDRLESDGLFGLVALGKPIATQDVPKYYTDIAKMKSEKSMYRAALVGVDLALVAPEVVFAANVDLTTDDDTLRAGTGTTVRFAGSLGSENVFSRKLQLAVGSWIDFDAPEKVVIPNQIYFDEATSAFGAQYDVQGMVRVLPNREVEFTFNGRDDVRLGWIGIAGTAYLRNNGKGMPLRKYVSSGGCLVMDLTTSGDGLAFNANFGGVKVDRGGILRTVSPHSLSTNQIDFDVAGGELVNGYANLSDAEMNRFHSLLLGDGARLVGERTDWLPVRSNYSCGINAYGVEPSRIECAALWLNNGTTSSAFYDISVRDTTGNETSDLVVATDVVDKSDPATANYFLYKTGIGTLEFGGDETQVNGGTLAFCRAWEQGQNSGTIRFSGKKASFKALRLYGNGAFDVRPGVKLVFGDSSGTAWNSTATLTLKSRLERKALRFGTDANSLTAEQIAAIRYADGVATKTPVFALDENGYLTDGLGGGFFLRVR